MVAVGDGPVTDHHGALSGGVGGPVHYTFSRRGGDRGGGRPFEGELLPLVLELHVVDGCETHAGPERGRVGDRVRVSMWEV